MLINDSIDISTFSAVLSDKQIQPCNIDVGTEWLNNALNYLKLHKYIKYKKINLLLTIIQNTEQEILDSISNLLNLLQECTVQFDGYDKKFACVLSSNSTNKIMNDCYELNIELLSGYSFKDYITETLDHIASKTINIPGNLPTPAIITITVPVDSISITLTGFGDTIIINNLKANIPVIIDGEACTVLENGVNKFNDTDFWQFPVLHPGANTITSSSANCTVNISYRPRWI